MSALFLRIKAGQPLDHLRCVVSEQHLIYEGESYMQQMALIVEACAQTTLYRYTTLCIGLQRTIHIHSDLPRFLPYLP